MNIDIYDVNPGEDLLLYPSDAPRAANIVSVQIGSLEYAPDFGVDLKFFMGSEFEIQMESFQSYLINRLTESQINVVECVKVIESLTNTLRFEIGEMPQ